MITRFLSAVFLGLTAACFQHEVEAAEEYVPLTLQNAAASTGNGVAIGVERFSAVGLTVTISNTATVTFEATEDGTTWASKVCASISSTSATLVTNTSTSGTYQCNVAGLNKFRARVSAFTSGTVTVHAQATTASLGSGGGGGGGGGGGVTTDIQDGVGDSVMDAVNNAMRVNIVAGAGSGGTAMTDDAAFTPGTTSVTPAGAMFDDVTPDSVNEGDGGVLRMSANRNLYTTLRDAAGNERGANVNASNELLTNANTELPAATGAPSGSSAPTAPAVWAFMACQNSGGTYDPCQAGDNTAHDAVDTGSPLKIGARAETSISGATKVADQDRTNLYAGVDGVLIVRPHANLEDRVSGTVGITDGSSTAVVAAQGAGIRFCATTITVSNSSATNVTVDIRDGTAGSVLMTIPASANMGGSIVALPVPLCTTANTAFAADPSASASTVAVSAVGFKTAL